MKIIATIAAALVAAATLAAPSAASTEAKRDHNPRILVVGDSITGGGGTTNPDRYAWPTRLGYKRVTRSGGCIVTPNCTNSVPAVETYDRDVLSRHPDVVVIGYGINDIAYAQVASMRVILAGIEEMAAKNAALGIETYVATVTPIRGGLYRHFNPGRVELNRLIRKTFGDHVIDFAPALTGREGRLAPHYDSGDKLHPNARAYRLMAQIAADTIG